MTKRMHKTDQTMLFSAIVVAILFFLSLSDSECCVFTFVERERLSIKCVQTKMT